MVQAKKVRLVDVSALTFYSGKKTAARRTSPIQQLVCSSSSNLCRKGDLRAVQCRNVGNDGDGDVQWSCEADLPNNLKFGSINVNCEGYEYSDDPFVLKGSCGLEYSLTSTSSNSGYHEAQSKQHVPHSNLNNSYNDEDSSGTPWLFLILTALAFYFIFLRKPSHQEPNRAGAHQYRGGGNDGDGGGYGGRGGYGGGGRGDFGGGGGGNTAGYGGSYTQQQQPQPERPRPQQRGWGNFWQGLGLGYLAGNMGGGGGMFNNNQNFRRHNTGGHNFPGTNGGGGGGGATGTHASTGQGGTSRR